MKAQILKLAKVKDEKSFYKKYPTEESFMAVHGAKLKKMKLSDTLQKANVGTTIDPTVGVQRWNDLLAPATEEPLQVQSWMKTGFDGKQSSPFKSPKNFTPYMSDERAELFGQKQPKSSAKDFNPAMLSGPAGQFADGIVNLLDERKQMKTADQWNQVSALQLKAARMKPEEYERDYVRPEDYITSSGEMFPQYFTKNGGKIKKKAKSGADIMSFMNAGGTDVLSNYAGKAFDYNAGSQIGGAVGGAVKYIPGVGPVISAIAEPVLTAIGGAVDPYARKIKKYTNQMNNNINNMALMNASGGVQQQYSGFMEDGGRIQSIAPERFVQDIDYELVPITSNNIYNPNLSFNRRGTTFRNEADEIDSQLNLLSQKKKLTNKDKAKLIELEDNKRMLFDYQESDNTKKFKSGGNVDYAMGGDLQLYDGNAEMMSNNPYSPEEGQTMMLKGLSHAEGGMDISYGGNPVEAEGGEPVMKGQDGDLTIFGNMKIGKELVPLLGDNNAKGKKFKNYIADLSREEEKHNKLKDKSVMSMSDFKIETPLDKLKANSFKYNAVGADSKLQNIAEKKQKASALQTAMLDTANEIGIDPDALSRGKIKKAKMGTNIPKAINGYDAEGLEKFTREEYVRLKTLRDRAQLTKKDEDIKKFQEEYHLVAPKRAQKILAQYDVTNKGKREGLTNMDLLSNEDALWGKRTEQYSVFDEIPENPFEDISLDKLKATTYNKPVETTKVKSPIQAQENNTNNLSKIDMLQSILPYFRPTDAETLDPRQLAGEMYALSNNQLEPVQAQQFQPELSSPYKTSLQDIKNQNQADYRSIERILGYNPAALSILSAQKYEANQKVGAEEDRINREREFKTFGENRNLLNNAKLQNLQILDNQYTRQAQAKSNTKDINQAALSSIASKYQQNELERKTLQTYENMYNYRYGNNMRMQNWNSPAFFNPEGNNQTASRSGGVPPEGYEYVQTMRKIPKSEQASNGGIVSAYRKL